MLKKYNYLFRTVANVRGMYSYLKKKNAKMWGSCCIEGQYSENMNICSELWRLCCGDELC